MKLIISNIYIPPASSCSNGYQSSIEHLLTTQDSLILVDFNAHHPSWYSGSTDTRGRKIADSINGSNHGILNWDTSIRVPPNAEPSLPDASLASASLITSCAWQSLSTLGSERVSSGSKDNSLQAVERSVHKTCTLLSSHPFKPLVCNG